MDIITTFCFWCFWVTLGTIAYAQRPGAHFEFVLMGALIVTGIALSLVGLPVIADGGILFILIVIAADIVGLFLGRALKTKVILRKTTTASGQNTDGTSVDV